MASHGQDIHRLIQALEGIRTNSIDMPAQQIQTFLTVALRPGPTMEDLGATWACLNRQRRAVSRRSRNGTASASPGRTM
jgi:hypothetical protein